MLLPFGAVTGSFADDNDNAIYIRSVEIIGNSTTHPEVFNRFVTFKVGDVLDVSALAATRNNLIKTQLYDKVDILPNMREDGVYVFIILKEAVRQNFRYSGEYGTHIHGDKELWWSIHLDANLSNFRGRLEELSGGVSFWEHRGVRASWHKPLLSTPYFIGTAASISVYPDEWLPIDYRDISARMTVGRYIGKYSQVSLSAIPIQRRREIKEEILLIRDTIVIPLSSTPDIYEAFGVLGLVNDLRNRRFDPQSGWFLRNEVRTNRLYYDLTEPFFQYRNDFRFYQPLLFDDMMVLRFSMTLRDRDAGYYHRLLYGDAGQVRGYNQKELGWGFTANSSVLMSAKYHKPIWKAQPVGVPLLNTMYSNVQKISYRIDATLIADYARIYSDPQGALLFKGHNQEAAGLGGGIRVVFPEIRQSGCIDFVYGRHDKINKDGDRNGYEWKPVLHVYFDLFY
jgi:outer membrane protein assembly factor BamA